MPGQHLSQLGACVERRFISKDDDARHTMCAPNASTACMISATGSCAAKNRFMTGLLSSDAGKHGTNLVQLSMRGGNNHPQRWPQMLLLLDRDRRKMGPENCSHKMLLEYGGSTVPPALAEFLQHCRCEF